MLSIFSSSKQRKDIFTIGFYNVENLFDTVDDPTTFDDDFTSDGKKKWNNKRYRDKIKKLGSVISQLGNKQSHHAPAIVGLVEVENAKVVSDLANSKNLRKHHYDFVHYDSPDDRGIDVALLYNKQLFELLGSENFPLYLEDEEGKRDYTRDVLVVYGNLNGELVHILVNHWPSRREGTLESEYKRVEAAKLARTIVEVIQARNYDAKIMIMGDFNDDPTSKSVKEYLVTEDFYNPMEKLLDRDAVGTLTYNSKWNLFDQIIITKNFLQPELEKHHFKHAEVFNKEWLKIFKGKLKGSPFRTYIGPWYQGGFSDHFPVYLFLKKEE
ncbi:endonuclease/exonuclease/phosphatase family protein [Polaribacter sp. Hel1_85]|uniref:endonuclease/exonuclease/phosphatase family protein n=1 Tax=Polaribacter sp. Hel1_85 TaxID=1250005 RepID=UPI00052D285E|nr:endonuclease/exonuclease/phosphatase family protein [Polaribacter sp. Hel1_85]KGL61835.1 endonuclease/exonuclease/phosphatase family protein [Polaribacter sp. Hel1_85]